MFKTTRVYLLGIVVLVGRVSYLFVNEGKTGSDSDAIFALQNQEQQQQKTETQREEINDTDLEKAVAQLAENDYSTTTIAVDQGMYDIQLLTKLYQNNPSEELAALLLQYNKQELWYDQAWELIQKHPGLVPRQISWQETLHTYANTSHISVQQTKSILNLQQKIDQRSTENKLSVSDRQRYGGLIDLRNGNVSSFLEKVDTIDHPYYHAVQESLLHDQTYVKGQKEVPPYYLQALLGLSLLQHQYLPFAEKVAIDVIAQDPNYILPYQILAYTTFLQRDREQSTSYIRELLARDTQQRPVYQFMLGVIAYRQGQYQEAILYFVGVDDATLETDTYRYLALSYIAIGDTTQTMQTLKKLVENNNLTPSDYYYYFYRTYFHPYRTNTAFTLLEADRQLALRYHQLCREQLDAEWDYLCDYGEVGQLLVNKQYDQAFKRLLYLAKYYPQSYFFEALGDYYQQQDKTQEAIMYYLQAIRYTKDSIERIDATQKIRQLIPHS